MSKYIVDIPDGVEWIIVTCRTKVGFITRDFDFDSLEELNSDYINEHFGDLQDEAYQRGLEEGKKATWELVADASNSEYQKGLNDAWKAARKIVCDESCGGMSMTELAIFNRGSSSSILRDFTAQQAIEKLKAYEEKQSDKIDVGDEVINIPTKTKGILLEPETEHLLATVIVPSLRWRTINIRHANLTKTGKHYNVEDFLEAMKHD